MTQPNGYFSPTYYYYNEGRENIDKTVDLVYQRLQNLPHIKKVLVFTSNGEGAYKIKNLLRNNKKRTKVIAVTFPYGMPFHIKDKEGNKKQIFAETSDKSVHKELKKNGIQLVQGVMALQDIYLPNSPDTKIKTINSTLSMISGGLRLCIESIIMATDSGHVIQGEEVISFSADTAIVATGCRKDWLFHPELGLEVREFICKPRFLSVTHQSKEK